MLVGECGISPHYFLDEMTIGEVELYLDGYRRRNRESWEQTRMIAYTIAQCNSTKQIKLTDIMQFEWDKHKETITTEEDFKRIKDNAKRMEDIINGRCSS